MSAKWFRPVNVDINCGLRVIGQSKNSFDFISDEGDGYDIIAGYADGEKYAPDLKSFHYEEWAEQLENAAEWCRKRAKEKAAPEETEEAQKQCPTSKGSHLES